MSARHLTLGRQGEDVAAAHLRKKGYKVLNRNWNGRGGELDLVCEHKGILVFVEVKTRTPGPMNKPHHGLTPAKCRCLNKAAAEYLSAHDAWQRPCRFDLVAVEISEGHPPAVELVENAFELSPSTDGGWQPW